MLQFFGRGSAFRPDNNSAFFIEGRKLVLLDLPLSSFHKLIEADLPALRKGTAEQVDEIVICVTHTHADHIGGIPLLIHYAYYVLGAIPVTVVAPSLEVAKDLLYFIARLEGCDPKAYRIVTAEDDLFPFIRAVIPTTHTPALEGRCFGYQLRIGDTSLVYTGDTYTLEPFLPYLTEGTLLYTEIAALVSGVHLSLEENLDTLLTLSDQGVKVYLMHLDDEEKILQAIAGTALQPAPLYSERKTL